MRPLIRWYGYFTSPASPPSRGLVAPVSMNFIDVPGEEEADGDAEAPPMSIPPMSPLEELLGLGLGLGLPPMFMPPMPPMPRLSSAKTSSGVPVTPSSQSSSTTTHSSSYDNGSFGSSTISGPYRPRSSWTPT